MWLSDSGQTRTIRAVASAARTSHVIGARLTPRTISDRHAAGRTNGRHPPDVERPQQQNDGGQLEDGVGDTDVVTGGAQQSRPHGMRSRARGATWPPGCRACTRFATSRRGPPRPGGRYRRSRSSTRRARRVSWRPPGNTAARTAASSSEGVMAISSERSGALTNTRTRRRPASSVVENIPKPPPFPRAQAGGSREDDLRARDRQQQRDGQHRPPSLAAVMSRAVDLRRHFSTTT